VIKIEELQKRVRLRIRWTAEVEDDLRITGIRN